MQQCNDPDYDPFKDEIDSIDRGVESSGNGFYPTVSKDDNNGYTADDDNDGDAVNIFAWYPSLKRDLSCRDDHVNAISDRDMRNVKYRFTEK